MQERNEVALAMPDQLQVQEQEQELGDTRQSGTDSVIGKEPSQGGGRGTIDAHDVSAMISKWRAVQ
jgi:hypothetical protein